MTKVMGHKLDAIVCDTTQTAFLAIEHLKTCKYPPQTFLPVDGLHGLPSVDKVDRYDCPKFHLTCRFLCPFLVWLLFPILMTALYVTYDQYHIFVLLHICCIIVIEACGNP